MLHHLGQHKGEQSHNDRNEGQIGGEHRQGPPQLSPPLPQIALIVPAEEGTGPVQNKGDGKPDEQRAAAGQDLSQQPEDPVAAHQAQHQQNSIGDDQQNAPHPLFRHFAAPSWSGGVPLFRTRLVSKIVITIPCPPSAVNIPPVHISPAADIKNPRPRARGRGPKRVMPVPLGVWWPERFPKA